MRSSTWLLGAAAALALLCSAAVPAENSQQERMSHCNTVAGAKGLKGTDRQTFMKECLSGHETSTAKGNSQQEKMKTCNADATGKGLKGEERKTFMKNCLSGPATG